MNYHLLYKKENFKKKNSMKIKKILCILKHYIILLISYLIIYTIENKHIVLFIKIFISFLVFFILKIIIKFQIKFNKYKYQNIINYFYKNVFLNIEFKYKK